MRLTRIVFRTLAEFSPLLFNAARVAMVALFFISVAAYAEPGTPIWTNRYNGPGNSADEAIAIAVDGNGNVFVTGYSTDSSVDYATIAYSSGGVPLWTNRYNGPGNGDDLAGSITVDGSGNVFVTGYSTGSGVDYATIAYSSGGVPLWTNRYNGPGNGDDFARSVTADGNGNVFVTGESAGSVTGYDYATIAYSAAGVPLWTNRYTGPGNNNVADGPVAATVDDNGNVLVTGSTQIISGDTDYATIAYSSVGLPLWTNRYSGPGNYLDFAHALAVDDSGNVFVAGESWKGGFPHFETVDYATVAYSATGLPLWTNRYNGPGNGRDLARSITVDHSGNVFLTGSSSSDYATIAYSTGGLSLWTNRYNGPGNGGDSAEALAVDGGGNVYVTGVSYGGSSTNDYATIAYSNAGVPLWTNRYNGPENRDDRAYAIVVDGCGNVIVTGESGGSNDLDYATIKYSGFLSAIPLNYQNVDNQIALSWTNAAFSLQSAPAVQGIYTNIPGATSPYTNLISGDQQYFRLKAN